MNDNITAVSDGDDAVYFTSGSYHSDHKVNGMLDHTAQLRQANNPATGQVTIVGPARVGETLTANSAIADADGTSEAVYVYQWFAGDDEITGATTNTYTLTTSEQGQQITVTISFTDDAGNEESLTSEPTEAVAARPNSAATGQPSIMGTAQFEQTLSAGTTEIADADGLDNVAYQYQWLADDVSIPSATSASYTLTLREVGKTIKVQVTFTDDAGNSERQTSEATEAVTNPGNTPATGQPRVLNPVLVDSLLQVDTSEIADANGLTTSTYSYQWLTSDQDRDTEVVGATRDEYRVTSQQAGMSFKVRVTFTDDAGNAESLTSPAAHPPRHPTGLTATISGQSVVLDWNAPGHFPLLFDYQILRETPEVYGDTPVVTVDTRSKATNYTDSSVDPGVLYRYQVKAANWWNQLSAASEPVEIRAPAATNPATGQPAISGTPQVGRILTADTTAIADGDGLDDVSYTYRWLADDTEITGATAASYTLTPGEESKAVTVRVSFTDDAGNAESLTSVATAAAIPANTLATGRPAIGGTPQVDETLTASTTSISDADGLDNASYSFQWLADDAAINGATDATYTLTSSEEGTAIKVRVSFIDDRGNAESMTSAATGAVQAAETTEPPGAPADLSATTTDGTTETTKHIVLIWTAPSDEDVTGYQILRRRPRHNENTLLIHVTDTGSTVTNYTDRNVAAGDLYVYRVKAINAAGTGPRSNYVNVEP